MSRLRSVIFILSLSALFIVPAWAQQRIARKINTDRFISLFDRSAAQVSRSTVRIQRFDIRLKEWQDTATGAIIAQGYVVSKASQIEGQVRARLSNGRIVPAKFLAEDAEYDLGLLAVDTQSLPSVAWDTSPPEVGNWVITPGTRPERLGVGIVSVKERKVPRLKSEAVLGVAFVREPGSLQIETVYRRSAADYAGLQEGDVIEEIEEMPANDLLTVKQTIRRHSPGDRIRLVVRRGDEPIDFSVRLWHPPAEFPRQDRFSMMNTLGGDLSNRRSGFPKAIQHDTILRPEDCGGPVVNLDGGVIGLNLARAGRTESFLVSASIAKPIVDRMLAQVSR